MINMKVRVIKAFRDNQRTRFEGTIYETTLERATQLNREGKVKLIEPMREYNVPTPELETKKAKKRTTRSKK